MFFPQHLKGYFQNQLMFIEIIRKTHIFFNVKCLRHVIFFLLLIFIKRAWNLIPEYILSRVPICIRIKINDIVDSIVKITSNVLIQNPVNKNPYSDFFSHWHDATRIS